MGGVPYRNTFPSRSGSWPSESHWRFFALKNQVGHIFKDPLFNYKGYLDQLHEMWGFDAFNLKSSDSRLLKYPNITKLTVNWLQTRKTKGWQEVWSFTLLLAQCFSTFVVPPPPPHVPFLMVLKPVTSRLNNRCSTTNIGKKCWSSAWWRQTEPPTTVCNLTLQSHCRVVGVHWKLHMPLNNSSGITGGMHTTDRKTLF